MATKVSSPLARVLAARTGDWLIARVDSWLETQRPRKPDSGWFHPSSLGHQCDALLAFEYLGVQSKNTKTAQLQRILDNGTSRDKDWKHYLKASGLFAQDDLTMELSELHIRGTCDGVVRNPLTQELSIFELKTMNDSQWKGLARPLYEHMVQVHPYLVGKGLNTAQIVYENKNTQAVKQFQIMLDGDLWDTIRQRVLRIMEQIERRQLPLRSPVARESSCRYFHCCSSFNLEQYLDSGS